MQKKLSLESKESSGYVWVKPLGLCGIKHILHDGEGIMLRAYKATLGRIKVHVQRHVLYKLFQRFKLVIVLVRVGFKAYQIVTLAEVGMEREKQVRLAENTPEDWNQQYAFVCQMKLTSPYRVQTITHVYLISCSSSLQVVGYSQQPNHLP